MALRGERIGTAYIKIIADGTGLDKQVENYMDRMDKPTREGAEENAKAYDEAFARQLEKQHTLEDSLTREFLKVRGKFHALGKFAANDFQEAFGDEITAIFRMKGADEKAARKYGQRAGEIWRDGFDKTGRIDVDIERTMKRAFEEVEQEMADFERAWRKTFANLAIETEHTVRRSNDILGVWRRGIESATRALDEQGDQIDAHTASMTKYTVRLNEQRDTFRRWGNSVDDAGRKFGRGFGSGWTSMFERDSNLVSRRLGSLGDNISGFSDKFGDAFGGRSRNDFVHFFSKFLTFPIKIAGAFAKMGESIAEWAGSTVRSIQEAQGVMGKLGASAGAMTPILLSAGGAAAALGSLLAGIIVVMGPVAALISGLAAAITALGASVSFALAAGLGVLVGLLPLAVGGLGAVILAFKGLKDVEGGSQVIKDFKDAFKGLKEELAEGALEGIRDFAAALGRLMDTLKNAGVFRTIGKAVGDMMSEMGDFIESPAFRGFLRVFLDTLPDAINSFGDITRNIFRGFAGVFEAVLPQVNRFLDWISDLTDEFADWAESVEGQKKIKQFFDDAADSAETLWNFITDVGDALRELLFSKEAKAAGDTMFKSLSGALQDFVDFIKKSAANGDLEKWFENGIEVAEDLGRAFAKIMEVLDELDNKDTRAQLQEIFKAIENLSKITGDLYEIFKPLIGATGLLFGVFADKLEMVANVTGPVADAFTFVYDNIEKFVENFGPWMEGLGQAILMFSNPIQTAIDLVVQAFQWLWDFLFGNSIIPDMTKGFQEFWDFLSKGWNFIEGTLRRVIGWFKDFGQGVGRQFGKVKDAIGRVVGWFKDLPSKIGNQLGRGIEKVRDFIDKLGNAPGRARAILAKVGNFFKDLVDDVRTQLGKAWDRVMDFIGKLRDLPGKAKEIIDRVVQFFKDLPGKIGDALHTAMGKVSDFVSSLRSKFSDAVSAVRDKMGDMVQAVKDKFNEILDSIRNIGDTIGDAAKSVGSSIVSGVKAGLTAAGGGLSELTETVKNAANSAMGLPKTIHGPGPLPDIKIPEFARGGIVNAPTYGVLGEGGREAIVPLSLPTAQVDPSVRALAGYANTLLRGTAVPGTATAPTGRSIDVGGITIITPTEDPAAVANETIARLATTGYIA